VGIGYGTRYGTEAAATVPSTRLGKHCASFGSAASAGCSRPGRDGSGGTAKLNAEIMSPTVMLHQALMLGTGTLNRREMNFSVDVWSKTSLTLNGPRLYGEMTLHPQQVFALVIVLLEVFLMTRGLKLA
jgi:hypothetical protein